MKTKEQRKDEALKEYKKITDLAWEEYKKIADSALKEYMNKIKEIDEEWKKY